MFDAGGRGRGGGLSSVWLKKFTRHLRELRKAHERQAAAAAAAAAPGDPAGAHSTP